MIQVYNTLTRRKEPLETHRPGEVGIYSCGVTPYDLSHVGHARSVMVFDIVCRYLAFKGYRVTFVRNFTDVDDKIIRKAQQEGVEPTEISKRYIREFRADMETLSVLPPAPGVVYHDPSATDFIPEMVALIARLLQKGYAYIVNGDAYFEVGRFPGYGRLSGRNLDELLSGARVEVDERKRDPRDFALWKAAKPGEPAWPSPWGEGRPGWHIECSVMSSHYLGASFDIHGGGADLIFPHHDCEIAQSEADTGRPLARFWMHNGLVNLGAAKMSKSLGNVLTIQSITERHHADALRFSFMNAHYRAPIDFDEARLADDERGLGHLRIQVGQAFHLAAGAGLPFGEPTEDHVRDAAVASRIDALDDDHLREQVRRHHSSFLEGMDDDFNTAQARAALSELCGALNRYRGEAGKGEQLRRYLAGVQVLFTLCRSVGLLYRRVNPYEISDAQRARVGPLLVEREDARKRRDWTRADEIRARIDALGFVVEDSPAGPRVRWKGAPVE